MHRQNLQSKAANANFPVDLIRTVAIFLVNSLVHATMFPYSVMGTMMVPAEFDWWTTNVYGAIANLSVPLFVMLSGVLLLNPAKADEPLNVFFKKRFARIGLPMIFWTIGYFAWGYFVHGTPFTTDNVLRGILGGSYVHLWFLYLLVGLYLATPIPRILVKHIDRRRLRYFLVLWLVGTFTVPFLNAFGGFGFNSNVFVFVGWIGYFLLGTYLLESKTRPAVLYGILFAGLSATILLDGILPAFTGANLMGFFHVPLNLTLVAASAALFMLLATVPTAKLESHTTAARLMHWIGQNTLPIYLIHIIVLEVFEYGYLGFTLNMSSFSPILEIPLLTVLTFVVTALIVYPLKKIPYINKVLG